MKNCLIQLSKISKKEKNQTCERILEVNFVEKELKCECG